MDLIGHGEQEWTPAEAAEELAGREMHADIRPDDNLPNDTRLWASLQGISGGLWGGCVYDADALAAAFSSKP